MLTLTSAQEAAFNAAAEAMADLMETLGGSDTIRSVSFSHYPAMSERVRFSFYITEPVTNTRAGGSGPTVAAAIEELVAEFEKAASKPLKLNTAREAVDAIKTVMAEQQPFAQRKELIERIDALPIA